MFFNKRKPQPDNLGFSIPVTGHNRMTEPTIPQPPREMDTRYQQQGNEYLQHNQPSNIQFEETDNNEQCSCSCSITITGHQEWVEEMIRRLNN